MYFNLSVRNMKRSAKEYLIYFITLVLSVGLFYGFLSISSRYYQANLPVVYNLKNLQDMLKYPTVIIAFIMTFLIQYVNKNLLVSRQKEFALQTLIGMEQSTTAFIFFIESLILGIAAIICGIPLGILLSQGVTSVVIYIYGVTFQMQFAFFPDTLLYTIILFMLIFIIVGIGNIRVIRKMKIIDMINSERMVDKDFSTGKNIFGWIVAAFIVAVIMSVIGCSALIRGKQVNFSNSSGIYWGDRTVRWLYLGVLFPLGFSVLCCVYFHYIRKKVDKPILVLILSFIAVFCAISSIILYLELGILKIYPLFESVFILFAVFAFFDCISGLLIYIKNKSQKIRYNNLFLFGQLTQKIKSNSRSMAVIALVLTVAITFMALSQPIAKILAEYRKSRGVYDIVINASWFASQSMEELQSSSFSYEFVKDYLSENGYTVQEDAEVKFYFMNKDDYLLKNDSAQQEALIISLSDYNQLRTMLDYEELTLSENQFIMHWGNTVSYQTREQFTSQHTNIMINGNTYDLSSSYEERLGDFVAPSMYTPIYILPDLDCNGLTIAQIKYFCTTTEPLTYQFAEMFRKDIENQIRAENLIFEHTPRMPYVFTKTLIVDEGFSSSVISSLIMIYMAVTLLIICITILSLQLLSDISQNAFRFKILANLGVSKAEMKKLIHKQMVFWFAIPVFIAIIISIGIILYFTVSYNMQFLVYVGMSVLKSQILIAYGVVILLLLSYYFATWSLIQKKIIASQPK